DLWFVAIVSALGPIEGVFAQTTGTLRGTVKDPSDLVVVGAKVTATLETTRVERISSSDGKGEYIFPALPVGRYSLQVEAGGFKKLIHNDANFSLGRGAVIDLLLELCELSQQLTAHSTP